MHGQTCRDIPFTLIFCVWMRESIIHVYSTIYTCIPGIVSIHSPSLRHVTCCLMPLRKDVAIAKILGVLVYNGSRI